MATPAIQPPSRIKEVARLKLAKIAPDTSLDQFFRMVCEISSEAVGVERVGVWLFIDDRKVLRCANLFENSKGEHCVGAMLRVADFPAYFKSLRIRKAVPIEVASSEPWTAELAASYLHPLGITSMLDAGIFRDGELIGAVCHEHIGPPREWTTEDRDFAGSVADVLALRIQSAELRELRAAFLTTGKRAAEHEKSAALEIMAAGIAHDFRNLLTVFLASGEKLIRGVSSPAEAQKQGRAIVEAAERGIELARDLMAFSEPSEKSPKVCDLEEMTTDFLPALREILGDKYNVNYQPTSSTGRVMLGRTHFFRILMNLVVNARDSMPQGGPIIIRITSVKLTGDPSYQGSFAMLEVIDRGRGMDEATLKRIFDPYYSTKATGTGLGLAVVKQYVDRAGGLIRVESELGKGTSFRLFFPKVGSSTGATAMYAILPELSESG